ncbi:MAG: hypothetical protein O7G85_08875 [Planctomycetota bacterium]|nr:hypothetical protein [Planctomycetota bacterium]
MTLANIAISSGNTFYGQTTLHPLGVIAVMLFGMAILIVPRRWAIVPMLAAICFVAPAQRVVVFSLDFDVLRILLLIGWARVLLRGETMGLKWRSLDLALIAWAVSGTVMMTLLYMSQRILIYRIGIMYDALGLYFLFRCLVREWKDVETIALSAAWLSIPLAAAFMLEKSTGRNVFSIFGGVPDITLVRNGSLRCQGAYAHPILAGSFWASLLPLIIALGWRSDWRRCLAPIGLACATIIILASSSSTPMMAFLIAIGAMALYMVRRWMGLFRLSVVTGLLLLQIVMTNPIWHLLTKIDLTGGSTGWYRYKLIDDFLRHFSDWWLMGTKSTAVWREWGTEDITNQYVLEGVTGGLLTLLLFILVLVLAFRAVGRFEDLFGQGRARKILAWAIGSSLFVHATVFIGVSYFGQIQMLWYLTLAIAGSLSPSSRTVRRLAVMGLRPKAPQKTKIVGHVTAVTAPS